MLLFILFRFLFIDPATDYIYALSLHDALPIFHPSQRLRNSRRPGSRRARDRRGPEPGRQASGPDRKSTRLNSSHLVISYAVFCLKKKKKKKQTKPTKLSISVTRSTLRRLHLYL